MPLYQQQKIYIITRRNAHRCTFGGFLLHTHSNCLALPHKTCFNIFIKHTIPYTETDMSNIIHITDFSSPQLDVFARLSENQLLHYNEPHGEGLPAHHKKQLTKVSCFFVLYTHISDGLEPERVLPEKQSAHTAAAWAQPCLLVVFPSSASLYPPPAAVSSLTLPAHHKNRHPKDVGFLFFIPFFAQKQRKITSKSPEMYNFRAFLFYCNKNYSNTIF